MTASGASGGGSTAPCGRPPPLDVPALGARPSATHGERPPPERRPPRRDLVGNASTNHSATKRGGTSDWRGRYVARRRRPGPTTASGRATSRRRGRAAARARRRSTRSPRSSRLRRPTATRGRHRRRRGRRSRSWAPRQPRAPSTPDGPTRSPACSVALVTTAVRRAAGRPHASVFTPARLDDLEPAAGSSAPATRRRSARRCRGSGRTPRR